MVFSAIQKKILVTAGASFFILATVAVFDPQHILADASGYLFLQILASFMPLIGYAGLFLLLLLENASAPLPGEIFLPLAGYYIFVGRMSFTGVLTISVIASLLGSLVIFLFALKFGAPGLYWVATRIGISQRMLAKNEVRLCGKYGSLLIALSRFVPIFGTAVVVPAGALRIDSARFAVFALLGSIGSTIVYLLLGYSVAPFVEQNNAFLSGLIVRYVLYGLAAVCVGYISYFSLRLLRRRRARSVFVRTAAANRAA